MTTIENDPKPGFPFSMIEGMMPMYPMIAFVGWMIVLIAFFIGLLVLAPAQSSFLSDAKAVREAAGAGSAFVDANVASHVIEAWLPQFKFLGLGMGLMAITMALGTIAKKLRHMGKVIAAHMPSKLRPPTPPIPGRVRMFQLSTMMGLMLILTVLIIGVVLATGVVPEYWNHSIANELNGAETGSALLGQFATIQSYTLWLNPLRMTGMAFIFTGILLALTVIIGTLRLQSMMLSRFYEQASK